MPAKKRDGNNWTLDIGASLVSKEKVQFKVWAPLAETCFCRNYLTKENADDSVGQE